MDNSSWQLTRRKFITDTSAAAAASAVGQLSAGEAWGASWDAGPPNHIIPTANHERFLIKTSFKAPLKSAPLLSIDRRSVTGQRTDDEGRFWRFDVSGLAADRQYKLRIIGGDGAALCDAWPLKTFPAPGTRPTKLRILSYTCGGGFDGPLLKDKTLWLDMTARRRLLARGMGFQPDVVFANGDHIYWDVRTWLNKPFAAFLQEKYLAHFGGALDISLPMMHPRNAAIFQAVADYQIPGLYGTSLRSTPVFFVTDDHDNFENDEFDEGLSAMPPDSYGPAGVEQTQHMYYPEFLPDGNRPDWLPGGDRAKLAPGTNTAFGAFRYGKLLEALMYDCRRWVSYGGDHATMIPQWAENWLVQRTAAEEDTAHLLHIPSLPFSHSAGKLGEWYPDVVDNGELTIAKEKPGWQRGWCGQHQRLIKAISAKKQRSAVVVQGDVHASAVTL